MGDFSNLPDGFRQAAERAEQQGAAPSLLPPDEQQKRTAEIIESYRKGEETALEREKVALQREKMKRGYAPDGGSGPRQLVGRALSGVQARSIDWLWGGWMPKGYITLLAGETGAGKSTVLADITARVTTGAAWPGEFHQCTRPPGRVLWLGSEDSIEEMTVPRLLACKANLDNVVEIQGVLQDGKRNTFSLQDDLEQVAHWLVAAKTEGFPFAMLVIDPVTSYLQGGKLRKVDLNDAGQLRTVLEPWLVLAQQHKVAVVCVTHFAKDTTRAMLHRVLGSGAFTHLCRSLVAVMDTPGDDAGPHDKVMMQVKANLPDCPDGAWKFSTEEFEVGTDPDNGKPIFATRPVWEELDSAITPKSIMGNSRGPVSRYEQTFGMWVQAYFATLGPGEWQQVAIVRMNAIAERAASERWWDDHSGRFLEKMNNGGVWMCRPKTA